MPLSRRLLLHQIHPAKLMVDPLTGSVCLLRLWQGHPASAMAALLLPVLLSLWLVAFGYLSPLEHTAAGRYMQRFQTLPVQLLRFAGFGLAMWGAWQRAGWLCLAGIVIVVLAWMDGFLIQTLHRLLARN